MTIWCGKEYLLDYKSSEIDLLKTKIGEILTEVDSIRDQIGFYDDKDVYEMFGKLIDKYGEYYKEYQE